MAWQLTRVQTVDLATLPWSVQYQSDFRTLHLTLGEYHLHHNYITVCSITIDVSRGTLVLGMTVLFKLLLMAAWCATTTVAGDKGVKQFVLSVCQFVSLSRFVSPVKKF